MDRIKNVVLFGGQGSPSLFSPQTSSIARHDAQSSLAAAILLSKCHAAFLDEVLRIGTAPSEILGSAKESFSRPENLLAPDPIYRNNPIIQATIICLYQLLRYLSSSEQFGSLDFNSYLQQTSETAGFCSGILPASVVASSRTTGEYIDFGVEAFRLSFWVGYRSSLYCQNVLGNGWKTFPWSLVVLGRDRKQIETMLEEFQQSHSADLRIAAISNERRITLSGPGPILNAFRTFFSASTTAKFAHVHALYHGGAQMENVVDQVCQDLKDRSVKFPCFRDLRRPLRETLNGTYLTADHGGFSLVESVLRLMLIDCVDWTKTSDSISKSIANDLADNSTSVIRILFIGTGSQSILREPSIRLQNPLVDSVDLSYPPISTKTTFAAAGDSVAIVGMGVNYPNGKNPNKLWEALSQGLSSVEEIPSSRFDVREFYETKTLSSKARKMRTRNGNFLDDIWGFDNAFFNISPREAKSMDPQQRTLLHTTQAAMEDAGYVEDTTPTFQRSSFGCFIGVATGDYEQNLKDDIDVYYSPGNLRAFLSGKLSYAYQLSGPSVVVDTACSSSLVAIYQACRALQNNDCSAALAGGVNVMCSPDMYLGLSRAHFLSPTGQCKPFDASADGYCRGEGCGVFVLKRLADAIAEGDRIHGVIRGVEVNHSGNSQSITHPHAETQAKLFQRLLTKTLAEPESISVVEAHGTGTQAGDHTEISSINSVFAKSRSSETPLIVSSIKGNIGHSEAASGAAGLAKLLLMLRHKSIPVQASFKELNPRLSDLFSNGISIPLQTQAWKSPHQLPRRAILNNFGAAGSNAALLLEEYLEPAPRVDNENERSTYLFNISAQSEWALNETVQRCKQMLINGSQEASLRDICYTATARRKLYDNRISIACDSVQDLLQQLENPKIYTLADLPSSDPVVFVFSGQGGSYIGMGKELMNTSPFFRGIVTSSCIFLKTMGLRGILEVLDNDDNNISSNEKDQEVSLQCACLIIEYALAKLLISWNIIPDLLMGHSLGEYTALAVSGAIEWEECLRIVATRAQLMASSCSLKISGTLACKTSVDQATDLILKSGKTLDISVACYNSVSDCVIAGSLVDLEAFKEHCASAGYKATRLNVPYGYHSKYMDPIVYPLEKLGRAVTFHEPRIPVASTTLGKTLTLSDLGNDYFANHSRQPVRFLHTIQHLQAQGLLNNAIFLEIGPHPTTLPMIKSTLPTNSLKFFSTLQKTHSSWASISKTLCQLCVLGINITWREVFAATHAKLFDLPGHPMKNTEARVPYEEKLASGMNSSVSPLSGSRTRYSMLPSMVDSKTLDGFYLYETRISVLAKYITGHAVGGIPICPASIFIELALEAAQSTAHPPRGSVYVVHDMTFASPLVYDPNNESQPIRVSLVKNQSMSNLTFTIVSPAHRVGQEILYCSGTLIKKDMAQIRSKWVRESFVVRRQQSHLFVDNGTKLNTFKTKMLYETVFPRVVTYSSDYQTLVSLNIAASGNEGYGSFKIPDRSFGDACIALPTFTDTLLHAAGFIANTSTLPVDAYICSKVESVYLLHEDADMNQAFNVYCSLFDENSDTVLADAFALDLTGRIVAAIEGLHFKKVRLSAFKAVLERNSSRPTENKPPSYIQATLPPSPPETTVASSTATPREETVQTQTIKAKIVQTIRKTCGLSEDVIRTSKDFSALGIDSLMSLELLSMFQESFPDSEVNSAVLERYRSLDDLVMAIESVSSSVSMKAFNPVSADDSENSTAYAANRKDDIGEKICSIIAGVCNVEESEILPQKSLDSLGIDSLASIELYQAIAKVFDAYPSPDDVGNSQTVGDLEILVSRSVKDNMEQPTISNREKLQPTPRKKTGLIQIQSDESDHMALYLFHDGSGLCSMYSHLDSIQRNLFAFSNPKAFSGGPQPDSLTEMARGYASNLSAIAGSSIIVGGWSFGGVLAFEAAHVLHHMGVSVQGVILIDSPFPLKHAPLPSAIVEYITKQASTYSIQESTRHKLVSQFQSNAALLAGYSYARKVGDFKPKVVYLKSKDFFDSKGLCGVEYPWLGEQEARDITVESWRELVGQAVPVLEIPGNHFEAFAKENVKETSKQVREACKMIEKEA